MKLTANCKAVCPPTTMFLVCATWKWCWRNPCGSTLRRGRWADTRAHDFQLGDFFLPAKTTVLMSQFITHRDARFFPDPLRFDPERFTPEAKSRRTKLTYFPFGAGVRQCIGESFAWMEGVLLLATLAQKWKLRLVPGHRVEPEPLITLRPKVRHADATGIARLDQPGITTCLLVRQIHLGDVPADLSWFRVRQIGEHDHGQLVVHIAVDCSLESLPRAVVVNASVIPSILDEPTKSVAAGVRPLLARPFFSLTGVHIRSRLEPSAAFRGRARHPTWPNRELRSRGFRRRWYSPWEPPTPGFSIRLSPTGNPRSDWEQYRLR